MSGISGENGTIFERNVTRNKPKQRMQYLIPQNQLIRKPVALLYVRLLLSIILERFVTLN